MSPDTDECPLEGKITPRLRVTCLYWWEVVTGMWWESEVWGRGPFLLPTQEGEEAELWPGLSGVLGPLKTQTWIKGKLQINLETHWVATLIPPCFPINFCLLVEIIKYFPSVVIRQTMKFLHQVHFNWQIVLSLFRQNRCVPRYGWARRPIFNMTNSDIVYYLRRTITGTLGSPNIL